MPSWGGGRMAVGAPRRLYSIPCPRRRPSRSLLGRTTGRGKQLARLRFACVALKPPVTKPLCAHTSESNGVVGCWHVDEVDVISREVHCLPSVRAPVQEYQEQETSTPPVIQPSLGKGLGAEFVKGTLPWGTSRFEVLNGTQSGPFLKMGPLFALVPNDPPAKGLTFWGFSGNTFVYPKVKV